MAESTFDDTCPRCGTTVAMRYYGPCPSCVADLHTRFDGAKRAVEAGAYEPKMNVTVNAVALKDD